MIIGNESVEVITELNDELERKTLELANRKLNTEFQRMVPWMCLVCLTDLSFNDTSIFSHAYEPGSFLHTAEQLKPVAKFLRREGRPIMVATVAEETGLADSYQLAEQAELSATTNPDAQAAGEPHMHYIGVPSELGPAGQEQAAIFYRAKELVLNSGPFFSGIFYKLVHFAVPLDAPDEFNFSTHLARGALFFSPTSRVHPEITMAIALAHEMGHQALMTFQSADPLLSSALEQPIWSATRSTLRPAVQALQGAAALAYMLFFVRLLAQTHPLDPAEQGYLQETHDHLASGLDATLNGLNEQCSFTALGRQVVYEFGQVLAAKL